MPRLKLILPDRIFCTLTSDVGKVVVNVYYNPWSSKLEVCENGCLLLLQQLDNCPVELAAVLPSKGHMILRGIVYKEKGVFFLQQRYVTT